MDIFDETEKIGTPEIRSILENALFLVDADDDAIEVAGEFDAGLAGRE